VAGSDETREKRPLRQCAACRSRRPKGEMLRIVADGEGRIWPDVLQKAGGRGAYICMQAECIAGLRRMRRSGKSGLKLTPAVIADLLERVKVALFQICGQYLRRHRSRLMIGRDAVVRGLAARKPALVLLAGDAGEALKRQIRGIAQGRSRAGDETTLLSFADADGIGAVLGREKVAVLALETASMDGKFQRFCIWHERLRESE